MLNDVHPKLPEETFVKEDGKKFLFLIPSKPDWVVTNRNGAIALSFCDGTYSIGQIQKHLADVHPDPHSAITFLKKLYGDGFFQASNEIHFKKNDQQLNLQSVHLNIRSESRTLVLPT